jgi:hypothetical protein
MERVISQLLGNHTGSMRNGRSFAKTKQFVIEPTEDDVIGAVTTYLNHSGWHTWRNNTHGIYNHIKKCYMKLAYQQRGVPDILGFHKRSGRMLAVEVKIGRDTLSEEQHHFLSMLKKAKGYAFIAHTFDDFLEKYERVQDRINEELIP